MSIASWLRDLFRPSWQNECNSRLEAWADGVKERLNDSERSFVINIDRVNLGKYCSGKPVLSMDFNPLPYWTAEDFIEVQSNPQKEVKTMATVYGKNGKAHEAINFVICVDEGNTQLLTQGKVYANLGAVPASTDNIAVIDDRGLKQNFSRARFAPFVKEHFEWAQANRDYVNLQYGKLYRVSKTKDGASASASQGQVYCQDETGAWMTYASAAFKREFKVTFSEQYLAAKMQAAYGKQVKQEQPTALVLDFNATERRVMTATAIVQEEPIRYVQVQFEPNGKLYTYKHRGAVSIGDEAVVRVENSRYPELCGTKVVDVVNVLDHNPTNFDLRWLVSVVNLDVYRARQQAEENLKAAEAALERKVQSMMKEDMLRILAERDPEAAALIYSINQLKGLI